MRGDEATHPHRRLLRLLHVRTRPQRHHLMPGLHDEFLELSETLLEELSRPLTEEERRHGWKPCTQRQWRRWVKRTRDRYQRGRIPARSAGPIDFALSMSGVLGLDSVTCKLIKFQHLLDEKIAMATGEGIEEIRDDLRELADLSEDSDSVDEIRDRIREYDEGRARRQGDVGA